MMLPWCLPTALDRCRKCNKDVPASHNVGLLSLCLWQVQRASEQVCVCNVPVVPHCRDSLQPWNYPIVPCISFVLHANPCNKNNFAAFDRCSHSIRDCLWEVLASAFPQLHFPWQKYTQEQHIESPLLDLLKTHIPTLLTTIPRKTGTLHLHLSQCFSPFPSGLKTLLAIDLKASDMQYVLPIQGVTPHEMVTQPLHA